MPSSWVTRLQGKLDPSIGNELQGFMEPTNKRNGKSGKFTKTVFHFLKSHKNHHCKITVTGKATNAGDELGMKVPCQLFFLAKEKFIIIRLEKLSKLL